MFWGAHPAKSGEDNEPLLQVCFYCTRKRWLNLSISTAMRNPKPFTVHQPIPGQNFPTFLFIVYARSLAQAKAIVASQVAGKTIVVTVSREGAGR